MSRDEREAEPGSRGKSAGKSPRVAAPKPADGGKAGVVLLNPQIAKADGEAPVAAYIAALSGWKRDLAERLDALVVEAVPDVQKAVKWDSPFYGMAGRGWFMSIHTFRHYLKVAFFRGAALRPPPPGAGEVRDTRYLDIRQADELDEAQLAEWVRQAAKLPGFQAR